MRFDFTFHNPTRVHFGKEAMKHLQEELQAYGPKVMLTYGGGSIKKNGIYDQVMTAMKAAGKTVIEFSGILSNPTLEKMMEGTRLAREKDIDFILAVGGGSVIDCSKAISYSAWCDEDPWEKFFLKYEPIHNRIIPVGAVLTMVGTGSEMNGGAVLINGRTKDKIGVVYGPEVYPKFAILNPEFTYTLPRYQMVSGFFDIMSHLMEQYFSGEDDNTSDYLNEGLMRSLIHNSRIALQNPQDYDARSNIMWTATLALNTMVGLSKIQDWEVHMIGQQVGGYTNCAHGMSLAAVSLPYYRHIYPYGMAKFARFAKNVWNISAEGKSDEELALAGLDALEKYMKELGLVLHLSELGATKDMLHQIAETTIRLKAGYKELSVDEIEKILQAAF